MSIKRILINISVFLILLTTASCFEVEFSKEEQVYPSINFEKIKQIEVYSFISDKTDSYSDKNTISLFKDYFKDSLNYYKNDSIKANGEKAKYIITFIDSLESMDIYVHPTPEKNKIELAFFDALDPDNPKQFRKYNRFYMTDELLELLGDESN